jgi:hypothetical protein
MSRGRRRVRPSGVLRDGVRAGRERERLAERAGATAGGGEGGERAGEAAQAIYVDQLCGNTALWITDNFTYGDVNHMICFDDAGSINMPLDWVGAFWGGAHTQTYPGPNSRFGGVSLD